MVILLTGAPGCGKSTLVAGLIRAMEGRRVCGIVTPEVREAGRRTGFRIVDLASGAEEILASDRRRAGPRVGRYGVNVAGVERIVERFWESLPGAEVVFLDEIGRMELHAPRFRDLCERVFDAGPDVVAVVHRGLAERYRAKGELIRVERERIPGIRREILARLGRPGD